MLNVRLVAHRGGGAVSLENTLPAFEQSGRLGVDAVEIDVLPTADGILVAYHDDSLQRLAGIDRKVFELPWQELQEVPIGTPDRGSHHRIPTLRSVAEVLPRRTELVLDMKHHGDEFPHFGETVAAFARDIGPDRVSILSVHHEFLMEMGRTVPGLRPLFNYRAPVLGSALPDYEGVAGLALGMKALTPDLLVAARERGWLVYLWTPNTVAELTVALGLGVDAVITDNIRVAWDMRKAMMHGTREDQ